MSTNNNRVWLELEKPKTDEQGQHNARLANNMLMRLCGDDWMPSMPSFSWSTRHKCYEYGDIMGVETLSDNGRWFNLDYFGRGGLT